MCGIGGIIKRDVFTFEDTVAAYLMLNSLVRRGMDAWGFFDGTHVYKEPGSFFTSPSKELVFTYLPYRTNLFLCHTRLAIYGDPMNNENNHPLVLYPFVMAHNGIIFYSDPYPKPLNIQVDSYDLLYWIHYEYQQTKDIVKAIDEGVKHVAGLYAIWLYNYEDGSIYVFRNRCPILITSALYGEGIAIFASDRVAIRDTLTAYSYKTLYDLKLFVKPFPLRPNIIYKVTYEGFEPVGVIHPSPINLDDYRGYMRRTYGLLKYHVDEIGDELYPDYVLSEEEEVGSYVA